MENEKNNSETGFIGMRSVPLEKDMDKYLVNIIKAMYNSGIRYKLR